MLVMYITYQIISLFNYKINIIVPGDNTKLVPFQIIDSIFCLVSSERREEAIQMSADLYNLSCKHG